MFSSSVSGVVDAVRELDDVPGISLVALALAFLTVGYAGGSVLAGEPVESQAWLVATVLPCLVAVLALHSDEA
ncbi:hypothetical protein M0R89_03640 [Halorussus limi]|uniref:Uncharacterized protein n=1 Tax=Halorussus limi TaxID=2938695 RepID=A0A8U0HW70_9EURY|nr:hypothetical protein [Halorussus limi]UPV75168.1 hypothetical protein M0R89_03640 [Halorussus limi]